MSIKGKEYWKSQNYLDIHMSVIIIGLLGQSRVELDTKPHVYIFYGRFSDHEQAQIATAKIDFQNKITVVGCLSNIDIDIDEFYKY